eukprot:m.151819 g.151819  ORF g.151819 m.151819 type:complete len:107 (+) comp14308_c0_seq1:498-818(+)
MAAGDWSAAGPALPSGDPRRLEAAGGQRGPRRAARLNRSDLLMENPQKTLFTSDGDHPAFDLHDRLHLAVHPRQTHDMLHQIWNALCPVIGITIQCQFSNEVYSKG